MNCTLVRGALGVACAAFLVAGVAPARQNAAPKPPLYVITDVRLSDADDAQRVDLVLRDGRIERVLDTGSDLPAGARTVEGKGMLLTPALIDAATQGGCETPTPEPVKDAPPSEASDVYIDMRQANRKGIQPAFKAADVFNLPKDKSKPWRESGFGVVLSAPSGQLLAGTSALCTTRDAAMRDVILAPQVFAHAAFRAGGPGYPSTLMGYHAQLRQFFLDVAHHAELSKRYEAGRAGPRPAFDADLEAGLELMGKQRRVMCEAESAQDIQRWVRLADELDLEIGIVGGREAWKVAELLKTRAIPVVLTLEWGDEPKDPHEKDKKAKPGGAKQDAPKKDDAETKGANATTDAPATRRQHDPSSDELVTSDPAKPAPTEDARNQLEERVGVYLENQQAARKPADVEPVDPPQPQSTKPDETKPDETKPAEKQTDEKKADTKVDEKKQWEYEEPLGVREAKRTRWEEGRDCARKLHEAGVKFCFGSAGGNGADLLKKVRTTVEHGLPAAVALEALSLRAAKLVGAENHLGAIQPGADATLALWTANPVTKDAKLAWLFIDGFAHEFELAIDAKPEGKPDEGVDASGTWDIEIKSERGTSKGTLELKMESNGDVAGTLTTTTQGGTQRVVELKGHVGGKSMALTGTFTMRETEVTNSLELELDGDSLSGSSTVRGGFGESSSEVTGTRTPQQSEIDEDEHREEGCCDDHP